jgi:hypothetical protein
LNIKEVTDEMKMIEIDVVISKNNNKDMTSKELNIIMDEIINIAERHNMSVGGSFNLVSL